MQKNQQKNLHVKHLKSAQIIALSHIFMMNSEKMQLIEVMSAEKIYQILVSRRKIHRLTRNLRIGGLYNISHLCCKQIKYSDGSTKKIWGTMEESKFVCLNSVEKESLLKWSDLGTYKGVVTAEICAPLGIYELDELAELHVYYLSYLTKLRCPQVGKMVTVYNAHWEIYGKKHCLILCPRGYIEVHAEGPWMKFRIANLMRKFKITYSNMQWLKRQLSLFEQKFTTGFLKANNLMSDSDAVLDLLHKCVELHYPDSVGHTWMLTKEFMSQPHSCGVLDRGYGYPDYEVLVKICDVHLKAENVWSHHNIHTEDCVVGVLTASPDSGYWVLSDATHSVTCLITGTVSSRLHGAVVLFTHSSLIVELFKYGKPQYYMHVKEKHIKVIEVSQLQQQTSMENVRKKIKVAENSRENCEKQLDLLNHPVVTSGKRTWLILVHHKSMPVKTGETTLCCLLISKINTENENEDGMAIRSERHYLLLSGQLVQYAALIQNNRTYRLVFPQDDEAPINKCRLKKMCNLLPSVMGFKLNEKTLICLADTEEVFCRSISDCYSIGNKKLYEDVDCNELINIEGIICDRIHIEPNFDSDKQNYNLPGFGTPDCKTVVLKLYDPSLNSQTSASLYINKWGHRSYPRGLVPGAKVQALFVNKVTSKSSAKTYFSSTDLTRLHVLEIGDSFTSLLRDHRVAPYQWGSCCILTQEAGSAQPGDLLWGFIRGSKILKFTATVVCAKCGNSFKQGLCTGCTAFPVTPKLNASAKCYVSDVTGQVIIFIKGDLVLTLLGIRKPYWDVIAKLVSLDGKEITLSEDEYNREDPPGKKLLQSLVQVYNMKKRQVYVFCRKMKPSTTSFTDEDALDRVPRLYCLDVQEPEAHLLYRSFGDT